MGSTLPAEYSRAWLTSLAANCLDVASDEIEAQVPLSQYGMDSLAQIQLSTALEIFVGRPLPDSFLCDHQDIKSIERFLKGEENPPATSRRSDSMCSAYLEQMRADGSLPPDIQPGPAALDGDNLNFILLTGATGFLGSYLLSTLLRETTATVLCLVRSSGKKEGQNRIQQNLKSFGLWEFGLEERIRVIPGDLSRPRLGWSKRQYQALSKQVNVIYHAAADVNWVYPYSQLREVNVQGTLNLLRLASLNKCKPFHFVSSLGVCYSTSGPREVSEEDQMIAYLDGIHLGYAQSKCVAETLVYQASQRGLPVSIYRPALVWGESSSGMSNTGDLLSTFLKGCIEMGCAPELDWLMDCCPVDFVASSIVRLSRTQPESCRVFHLANPHKRHWRECVLWMRLFGYPIRLIPYPDWLRQFEIASRTPQHALHHLRSFFMGRTPEGGLTLPELYEEGRKSRAHSARTDYSLGGISTICPRLNADLLDRYFTFYINCAFLPPVERPRPGRNSPSSVALDTSFFNSILRDFYGDHYLQVTEAVVEEGGSDYSIISELTSWRYRRALGLRRYRLLVEPSHRFPGGILRVMVKNKPEDLEVIEVGEDVAHLCGEQVGRAYSKFKDWLGLSGSHTRELAIYQQKDERFQRHAPLLYGTRHEDPRQVWILVLEHLSNMVLMDTADDVTGWRQRHIEAALQGIADFHSIWYRREAELRRQPWLGSVFSEERMVQMHDWWIALAEHAGPFFSEFVGPEIRLLQSELIKDIGSWWRTLEALPRTLIHNDFNPRNVALRPEPNSFRLCAYDWELATLGIPQHDLAELLCFVLPQESSRDEVLHYLEVHRRALQRATGQRIDADSWQLGFRLSLCDLMVNRFPMYTLVHKFRKQGFLSRIISTWARLYKLFPHREIR